MRILSILALSSTIILSASLTVQASDQDPGCPDLKLREHFHRVWYKSHDRDHYFNLPKDEQPVFLRKEIQSLEQEIATIEDEATSITCPLHQGSYYMLIGIARRAIKVGQYMKLDQVHQALNPIEKIKRDTTDQLALGYFQAARDAFETVINPDDPENLRRTYQPPHGLPLFLYAHTLKRLAYLVPDTQQKITYLDGLYNVTEFLLTHRDVCLNNGTLFTHLACADFNVAFGYGVDVENDIILPNIRTVLASIDILRQMLRSPQVNILQLLETWKDEFQGTRCRLLQKILRKMSKPKYRAILSAVSY